MKHTKKDLEKSIAQMKKVLDADSTSASTKELIRPNLEKAEKLLAELEDTGKKTVPPAKEKFADDAIKKAMQVGRKEKPLNKKQKETLKGIVAASKKLTKHYTGYTETDLKRDAARSADKPGRRVSASGKTYSEYRANRSDISSKAPHLAKGGLISKDEKVTLMLATNYLSNYKKTLPASSAGYNEIDTIISKFKTDPADYGNLNMAVLYLQLSEKEITRDANAQATLKGIISQLKTMANKHGAKNSFAAGGVVLSKDKNGQISSVNRREDGAILSVGQETLSGKILSFVKDKSYQGGIGVELDNKGRFVSINVISLADEIDEGNFIIEVDGDPITLDEFIDVNENLEDEYLDKVKLLQPGETTELFFGAGGTSIVSRPATMAAGGTTDDPMWHHVGLNRPPNNFTPAATKAFKDAIELLEKETDKDGAYYKNAKASLTSLVYMVNDMLAKDGTKATEIHYLLQKVGIYNYKTGLLVDTSFLDKELAARKLEHGGRLLSAINRDRAYKSQQPHEQAYKRKTSPKNPGYKYAGGGPIPELYQQKK